MANLCAFIDALDTIRMWLQRPQTAIQWQQTLNNVLELVFQSHEQQVESELITIRKTIDQLVDCTELAGFEQEISLELLSEWLTMHLDSEESQSRFMGNGITFCGMVPMRSIPFDVVCLIGMNDDSYPRRQPKIGFDLLANDFRIGDRSRREDDRYLFLEAVLSAQSKLYISYVGASIHDNAVIPPSVLVSDLRDVLTLSYSVNGDELWPHIFTQHPLQAFSRRYFNQQDDKLFSYQQHNCPDTVTSASTNWFEQALPEADKTWREVSLTQLINFYRHPVRYLLTERLGLRLELDDDQLDIREPFQLDGLDAWQLRQQLLSAKLADTSIQDIHQYVEASGVLPQGLMGEQLFEKQQQQVDVFADTVLTNYPDSMLEAESIDLQLGEFQLNGQLQSLSSQGQFFYRMAKTKGSDIIAAWIQHLVLNIIKPNAVLLDTVLLTEDGHYHFKLMSDAEIHLQQLLDLYWQGLHQPLAFFNNTSFAYAKAALNEKSRANPDNAIWTAWLGGQFANAEADDVYLQQVFEGQLLEEQLKQLAEMVYTPIKNALEDNKL
jgi:exodeoxyribonuclease V gamma subunit